MKNYAEVKPATNICRVPFMAPEYNSHIKEEMCGILAFYSFNNISVA